MNTLALKNLCKNNFAITAVILAAVIPLSNSLTTAVSLVLLPLCLLQLDRNKLRVMLFNPTSIAILVFIALNIIDLSYTIADAANMQLALRKVSRLLYFPLLLPFFIQVNWRHAVMLAFISVVFVSVVAAIYAQHLVFKDSIFTSLFVAYAIYVLAHYSVEFARYRWLAVSLAIFFTYYLFFIAIGRSGQLIFVALYALFVWQRVFVIKLRAIAAGIFVGLITASLLLPSSFAARKDLVLQEAQAYMQQSEADIPEESSIGVRLILAHNAWELIKLKPLLGWGTGSFTQAYAQRAPEAQVKEVIRTNPHNQYLLTWVELGLPGLLALLGIFATLWLQFYTVKNLAGYLGCGLVLAIALGCGFNSWLLDFTSMFFFVVYAAVLAGTRSTLA